MAEKIYCNDCGLEVDKCTCEKPVETEQVTEQVVEQPEPTKRKVTD